MTIAIGEELIYKYDTKPSISIYIQKHFASSTLFESNSGLQMGKKIALFLKKMFLKVYCTHLSVTAPPTHRKCSYTDLLQKEPSGKQLGKTYRSDMKVYFIYFIFSRWPSSRTSACTSLRILEWFRDGNRSVNIADSKCWWGALLLVRCLEEEGLHTVIK